MPFKKVFQLALIAAMLLAALASTGSALAWSGCGSAYTVRWGDTLGIIAGRCGTSVDALRQANPNLGYYIYPGQVLAIPGYQPAPQPAPQYYPNYGGTYVVQWGDTLRKIADRYGVGVNDILAANPYIWNPNWIFAGQVISLPARPVYYTVQYGDTLRIIAGRYGTSVYSLQLLNPQIYNPNWIYAGEVIRVQ